MNIQRFRIFEEDRGHLLPVEFFNIPFIPKRIFTVSNVPKEEIRGEHAHCTLRQYLLCVKGEIEIKLFDGIKTSYRVLKPGEAVLVEPFIWDSQKFLTGNDVLLVFASEHYDKEDYILDKQEFINWTRP